MMLAVHANNHKVFKFNICCFSGDIHSLSPCQAGKNQAQLPVIPACFQTVKGQGKIY
jgi:hypothetical protein